MRILHVGDDFAALRPCGLTLYSDALMQAQSAAGHEVSYLFSGRHYPLQRRARLRRWSDRGVAMFELVGSPIHTHWAAGTRRPDLDVHEPEGESAFDAALREVAPELVHVHELARLPYSLLDRAKEVGVPLVMTLHDYKPVCAAVRLLDADGRRCSRHDVGEDCARNCAGAPDGPGHLVDWTLRFELGRAKAALPGVRSVSFRRFATLADVALRAASGGRAKDGAEPRAAAPAMQYQRRRDLNLERLNRCDRLLAPSPRVAEIYTELGVDASRIRVQRLTLPHLERLAPGRETGVRLPLTFVTLGGCSEPAKGSRALVAAVRALERAGRGSDYRLLVRGHVEAEAARALEPFPAVLLQGPYEPADLDSLLDEADVGLMPSVWEEAHGFAGVEMLAKGLPLIGSDLGGIREYVREGETGWLNHSADGAGLAASMLAVIDDPAEVERLQRSVRERRGELVRPMSEHVADVEALYEELQPAAMRSPAARRSAS